MSRFLKCPLIWGLRCLIGYEVNFQCFMFLYINRGWLYNIITMMLWVHFMILSPLQKEIIILKIRILCSLCSLLNQEMNAQKQNFRQTLKDVQTHLFICAGLLYIRETKFERNVILCKQMFESYSYRTRQAQSVMKWRNLRTWKKWLSVKSGIRESSEK